VLVKSTGGAGLGDLIRSLLAALHYASIADRGIAVCWDDGLYGEEGQDVFPRLFRIRDFRVALLSELSSEDVLPKAWRGNLDQPMNRLYGLLRQDEWERSWALENLSFDQRRCDFPESTLVMWEFDRLYAAWNQVPAARRIGASPDHALRILAQRHLRPAEAVLNRVKVVWEREFRGKMVGVHVRKTFEKGGETRHLDMDHLFRTIDRLCKGAGDSGIFLATDNSEVEAAFRQRYPRVTSSPKWFGEPGVALHFNEEAPDKIQLAIEALVDLYLLAACDVLVHPGASSFSRVAAILGGLPPECVLPLAAGRPGPRAWWQDLRRSRRALRYWRGAQRPVPYFLTP